MCVADGNVKVKEGIHDPNVTTTCAAKDWIAITLGKLDGMTAFTSGKLKVEGDLGLLTKATKFFKKYTPPAGDDAGEKGEELIVQKKILSIPQRFATGPVMGKFLSAFKEKKILANRCPECGRHGRIIPSGPDAERTHPPTPCRPPAGQSTGATAQP